MKEMKDDTNNGRNIPCSWIRRINIVKTSILPKVINRFNVLPIKLSSVFFREPKQTIPQFVQKYKKPWMLIFKPNFSLSSLTFIKRIFRSSSLSAMRVMSHAYLRLWIFLPEIFISPCASSSLVFHMMYSAYKFKKPQTNIQPGHTPFPILNQSVVPCPVLTVPSWPTYRFLRRQVR